ncbi:hypothetical protein B0H19DRAFT_932439 [Mycena capillaripes]|nr:hypothetical protein B0H19DRAFT_932439 [Mycena capillaripes]
MFKVSIVDEATICPYCDTPLPESPSEILLKMFRKARSCSSADPRPGNGQGLMAATPIRAPVCSRHQFEHDLVPMALEHSWKTSLDRPDIERRLKHKKAVFEALIDDWAGNEDGPRGENPFWIAAVANIGHSRGGLASTYATFQKTQPGYYGEVGTRIIHEVFTRLLQCTEDAARPLSVDQFLALVLTPKAGVQLIMEDLLVDRQDAEQVMYASSIYGAQMFPDND